jgi:hypothetical protein
VILIPFFPSAGLAFVFPTFRKEVDGGDGVLALRRGLIFDSVSRVGRRGFDFVILFLVSVWGFVVFCWLDGVFLTLGGLILLAYVLLPALAFADVLCYVAGYITTWERQGGVLLG